MKAIVVKPGVKDSIHMRDMSDPTRAGLLDVQKDWNQYSWWFGERGSGIKTTLEIS